MRVSLLSYFSPNSLLLGVLNALQNGRLGAGWSGRVPGRLVSDFPSFVSQFFSFVSQAGCHFLSFVSHFFSFVSQFFSFVSQAGACGRVPSWLVSHFLSFVSHFFSLVSQFFHLSPTLVVGLDGLVGFPAGLSPTSFHLFPTSFHLSPTSFHLSPTSFHLSPSSFHLSQVGFPAGLSPTSFHLSPTSFHLSPSSFHLSPRLGACGRVPGCLVSRFLSFVSSSSQLWTAVRLILYICLPVSTFVSQLWTAVAVSALQSFVSQLWTSQALVAECSDSKDTNCLGSTVV